MNIINNYLVLAVSNDGHKFVGLFTEKDIAISICEGCRDNDFYDYYDVNVYEYSLDEKFNIDESKLIF